MTIIAILFLLSPRIFVPSFAECEKRWADAERTANEVSAVLFKARHKAGSDPTNKELLAAEWWHGQATKNRSRWFAAMYVSLCGPYTRGRWEYWLEFVRSSDNAFQGRL